MTLAEMRRDALECWRAAVEAVHPGRLVSARLRRVADTLCLGAPGAAVTARHAGPVLVVGAGKAARSMAEAVARAAGQALHGGIVIVPHGSDLSPIGGVTVAAGAHPVPDATGEAATRRLLEVVATADRSTAVLVRLAAARAAELHGYATTVFPAALSGDAASAGRAIAARLAASPRDRPQAIVAGGETTVRVVPDGRGGRCQQLALAAAIALAGEPAVLLAAGTDGVDGPTDAAGACVDGETAGRARARGLDPAAALARTDSHPLLDAAGDLVRTGPTGTNVADVVVTLRATC